MSSCLILQDKNDYFIGADTACSVLVNDKYYRCSNNMKKIFTCGNDVYFCAGNLSVVQDVVAWINYRFSSVGIINVDELAKHLYDNYRNTTNNVFDVEVIICRKTDVVKVYQLSQYNNFKIIEHNYRNNGINIICCGYKTGELNQLARDLLLSGSRNFQSIYYKCFSSICDNKTGGNVVLYHNNNIIMYERLNEKNVQFAYDINSTHLLLADACIASYIEGSTLVGGKIGIGERDDGSYNFSVNYEGHMIAQSADVVGKITADSGAIRGDLEISGALKHTNGNYTVQLRGVQEDSADSVFHIAEKSGYTTKYPFRINGDGSFVATKATITGKITTSDITATGGKIGGFDITDKYLAKTKKAYGDTYSGVYLGTDGIGLGAGKFYVTSAGKLTAEDATIKGKITTSDITATGGTIGGFKITSSYLAKGKTSYSDANDGVYIGTTGIGLGKGKFYVTSAGKLTATDANITGKITSTEGSIGGWTIEQNMINGKSGAYEARMSKSGIGVSGNVVFGVYNGSKWSAYIDGVGKLYASGADIEGTIKSSDADIKGKIVANSGTIGGCKITGGVLYVSDVNINGVNVSKLLSGTCKCNITHNGSLRAGYSSGDVDIKGAITATSGEIGGCKIVKGDLQVDSAHITSLDASKITTGALSADRVNGGTLSGCSISIGGNFSVNSSGNVSLGHVNSLNLYGYCQTRGWATYSGISDSIPYMNNTIDQYLLHIVKGIVVGFGNN